jgi:S-adenosylmethionine hydrolase
MTIITLTSDFGLLDPYVGIMKGVILGIAPHARLVDLTHEIPPQQILEGIFALESAEAYFPLGTIHLAVVDPGVGSSRRALLVTTPRAAFVGPDNGLFSPFLDQAGAAAWVLDRPEHWLAEPSQTFHGRDIFAPVAGALAAGILPRELGSRVGDAVRVALPEPARGGNGEIAGCVMHVDRFGNLMTNVPGEWLAGGQWVCQVGGAAIKGPSSTYAAVEPGQLILLVSSGGKAEVAMRDGSAAERLAVRSGAQVRLKKM